MLVASKSQPVVKRPSMRFLALSPQEGAFAVRHIQFFFYIGLSRLGQLQYLRAAQPTAFPRVHTALRWRGVRLCYPQQWLLVLLGPQLPRASLAAS